MTVLLEHVRGGRPGASDELFSLLYEELHRIAKRLFGRQSPGHTLQPTVLVHEAWFKMLGGTKEPDWQDRAHFVNVAARAMRQILVNHARDRSAQKRGGGRDRERLTFVSPAAPDAEQALDLLDLDDALKRLAALDERQAQITELKLFGGLTTAEIAAVVGIAPRTVELDWKMAKGWLARALAPEPDRDPPR